MNGFEDQPVFEKVEHTATVGTFAGDKFIAGCVCKWLGSVCNTEKEATTEAARHEFAKGVI